jgi:hypothetical protein
MTRAPASAIVMALQRFSDQSSLIPAPFGHEKL